MKVKGRGRIQTPVSSEAQNGLFLLEKVGCGQEGEVQVPAGPGLPHLALRTLATATEKTTVLTSHARPLHLQSSPCWNGDQALPSTLPVANQTVGKSLPSALHLPPCWSECLTGLRAGINPKGNQKDTQSSHATGAWAKGWADKYSVHTLKKRCQA